MPCRAVALIMLFDVNVSSVVFSGMYYVIVLFHGMALLMPFDVVS